MFFSMFNRNRGLASERRGLFLSLNILSMALSMALLVATLSCSSVPILDQEAPSLYFKAAEHARFQRKRLVAIDLYKLTQLRFADNFTIVLEAEFSIAQIYFSWPGHDRKAAGHYGNVINFYRRPEIGSDVFPQSYLNLARQNLATIKSRQKLGLLSPKVSPEKDEANTGDS